MDRRVFLEAIGMASMAMVTGCSSGVSPAGSTDESAETASTSTSVSRTPSTAEPTPSPTPEGTPTSERSRDHVDALSAYLAERDIDVRELRVDASSATVLLRYITTKSEYNELGEEIGGIAGGFLREVSRGWEMDRMDATMLNESATPTATWYVKSKWLDQYQSGEITGRELSLKILKTLERPE